MRRILALLTILLLALAGCGGSTPNSGVEPGDGPSNETPVHGDAPAEEDIGPTDEPSVAEVQPASFTEKVVYPDGVEVEVIRIRQGKVDEYSGSDKVDPGSPFTIFSIRVSNKSSKTLSVAAATGLVTYGPDGEEAEPIYQGNIEGMSGKIVKGKAKTGTYGFAIPTKYLGDVTLEFGWDDNYEHESAIFIGSVK